jgi:hypothetical protein
LHSRALFFCGEPKAQNEAGKREVPPRDADTSAR